MLLLSSLDFSSYKIIIKISNLSKTVYWREQAKQSIKYLFNSKTSISYFTKSAKYQVGYIIFVFVHNWHVVNVNMPATLNILWFIVIYIVM